ncbi:MAG: hypothetical protein METHP_01860 [Methanoregula sp. SKADARSKE-2]|nr:MAG: hypothetical protein METHP_01860 [Methanoregula sp. SKADARSKE-2]
MINTLLSRFRYLRRNFVLRDSKRRFGVQEPFPVRPLIPISDPRNSTWIGGAIRHVRLKDKAVTRSQSYKYLPA